MINQCPFLKCFFANMNLLKNFRTLWLAVLLSVTAVSITLYLMMLSHSKMSTGTSSESPSFIFVVVHVLESLTEPESSRFVRKRNAGMIYRAEGR